MTCTRTFGRLAALLALAILALPAALAQTTDPHADELATRIEVLDDFHEVIFQIWHQAWPEKNIAMLVDLLPQVKQYSDTLAVVKLPGILRDKQRVWDEGTEKLGNIVAQYAVATSPVDSVKLLEVAERLHAQYEALVRTIRPVTKELDQFHQVLYMIYHHYWPGKDLKKLEPAVAALKEKMAALEASKLPSRLTAKEAAFEAARGELARAVKMLTASDAAEKPEKFASDLEALHGEYQALERVFE